MATLLISGGQLAKLSDLSEQSTLSEQSVGKADLFSDHFDSKQSRECVDCPLNYLPSPRLYTFAVMSSEVRRLLLNLDPYRGSDPLGMFPLFHKRTADVLAPVLVQCFDGLFVWVVSQLAIHMPMQYPACFAIDRPKSSQSASVAKLPTDFVNISIVEGV